MDFVRVEAQRQSVQLQLLSSRLNIQAQRKSTQLQLLSAQVNIQAQRKSTQLQLLSAQVNIQTQRKSTQLQLLSATIVLRPDEGWLFIPTTPSQLWLNHIQWLVATITLRPGDGWRSVTTIPSQWWLSQPQSLSATVVLLASVSRSRFQPLQSRVLVLTGMTTSHAQILNASVAPRPATGWRVLVQVQALERSLQSQVLSASIATRPATGWRVLVQVQAQRVEIRHQNLGAIALLRPARGWREIVLRQAQILSSRHRIIEAKTLLLAQLQACRLSAYTVGVLFRPTTGWFFVPQIGADLRKNRPSLFRARVKTLRKLVPKTRRNLLLANAIKQLNFFLMPTIVQSFTEVESVCFEVSQNLAEQIIPIFHNNAELLIAKYRVDERDKMTVNSFIKNFRLTSSIVSLKEASFPEILLTDSEHQKTMKALEVEWNNPRIHLNLWDWNQVTNSWVFIAAVSLLNNHGYPYRIINLLDLLTDNLAEELGANARIGVNVVDVGYGRLSIRDKVTIRGVIAHEVVVVSAI